MAWSLRASSLFAHWNFLPATSDLHFTGQNIAHYTKAHYHYTAIYKRYSNLDGDPSSLLLDSKDASFDFVDSCSSTTVASATGKTSPIITSNLGPLYAFLLMIHSTSKKMMKMPMTAMT
jgi:hypothetical protein